MAPLDAALARFYLRPAPWLERTDSRVKGFEHTAARPSIFSIPGGRPMRRTAWMTPFAVLAFVGLASVACQSQDAGQQQPPAEAPPAEAPPQQPPAAAVELPPGVTQDMVAQGQQIFGGAGLCFTCHGPDGTGMPNLGPNLTDGQWLNIDG